MGCCKCEEHKWEDPQPVEYVDEAGKGYCLFHAPANHKIIDGCPYVSVETFNLFIFNRINAIRQMNVTRANGFECKLAGIVFMGDICFSSYCEGSRMPDIDFRSSVFHGVADFTSTVFEGKAIFMHCHFNSVASFIRSRFLDESYFWYSRFYNSADFDNSKFSKRVDFVNAIFLDESSFFESVFTGSVIFDHSLFIRDAHFTKAVFESKATFHLTIFGKEVSFSEAKFLADSEFKSTSFNDIASFGSVATGANPVELFQLDSHSIGNILFSSTDTRHLNFVQPDWPEMLQLESREGADYKACGELYRSLKQKAATEHDQPLVSRWHYREKLMHLRELVTGGAPAQLFDKVENGKYCFWYKIASSFVLVLSAPKLLVSLDFWYWATSGFGERERRAGIWLAILICLPLILNAIPQPIESFPFSVLISRTLDHIPFTKDLSAKGGWVRLGQGLSQFFIALQTTIFAFALRNRFRR